MNYNEFVDGLDHIREFNEEIDRVYDDYKIDISETPLVVAGFKLTDDWINSNFTVEGQDWVNWYLFEDVVDKKYEDENGVEHSIESDEDLWNFLQSEPEIYIRMHENLKGK